VLLTCNERDGAGAAASVVVGGGALQMPAGLVLLSPWVDMTCDRESRQSNAGWVRECE
jgi:acetyl esterase/lipase